MCVQDTLGCWEQQEEVSREGAVPRTAAGGVLCGAMTRPRPCASVATSKRCVCYGVAADAGGCIICSHVEGRVWHWSWC